MKSITWPCLLLRLACLFLLSGFQLTGTFWAFSWLTGRLGISIHARVDSGPIEKSWGKGNILIVWLTTLVQTFRYPRRCINLITRLRPTRVCTGTHFIRMRWTLPTVQGWRIFFISFWYVLFYRNVVSLYFGILSRWFPGVSPKGLDLRQLLFDPDENLVSEIGMFFSSENIILQTSFLSIFSPTGGASDCLSSDEWFCLPFPFCNLLIPRAEEICLPLHTSYGGCAL